MWFIRDARILENLLPSSHYINLCDWRMEKMNMIEFNGILSE